MRGHHPTMFNMLGCWVDGMIVSLTKRLMFQVSLLPLEYFSNQLGSSHFAISNLVIIDFTKSTLFYGASDLVGKPLLIPNLRSFF